MCWHAPTVRLYIGRPMLKSPPGYRYPAWAMNALGGIPATIDPTVRCAAKVIGLTVVDLLSDGEALAAARREFEDEPAAGSVVKLDTAAVRPRTTDPFPLARICDHGTRRGMVDSGHAGLSLE